MPNERIFLDNQSTTPVDPIVLEAMLPYFKKNIGNPHSDDHIFGWDAAEAIDLSRHQVAKLINADKFEIIFTSGATESVNLALQGITKGKEGGRKKIVTATTEHSSVLECCEHLESLDFDVVRLPVKEDGLLDTQSVAQAIDEKTLLVSIMLVNNEIGVIQPLHEISEICKQSGVILHTDATQAIGKIPVDVDELGADLLSISGHKFYGPKGIGALYVRKGIETHMTPIIYGGGQEKSLRPGTLPVPLIVGFGQACVVAEERMDGDNKRISLLSEKLLTTLQETVPDLNIFGSQTERIKENINIGFPNVKGAQILSKLGDKLAISTGSACASTTFEPSHVLQALGFSKDISATGIRISLGRFTTEEEIELAAHWLLQCGGVNES
jgi:cysteine desulfurase